MAVGVRPGRLSGVKVAAAAATAAPLAAAAGRGWDIAGAAYWTWAAAATAAPLAAAEGQGWDTAEAAYWTWEAASLSIQRVVLSEDEEGSEHEDYQKAGETKI